MAYRILVTGSRDWDDFAMILAAIAQEARGRSDVVVVHGAARGADRLAGRAAARLGLRQEPHPADWRPRHLGGHGRGAGHVRNAAMVARGADVALAFFAPGAASRGTTDCVRRCRRAGIPVRPFGVGPPEGPLLR